MYFSGWLWKQDLDRNVNGFFCWGIARACPCPSCHLLSWLWTGALGASKPPPPPPRAAPCIPTTALGSPKAAVQACKKFFQLFAELGQLPPSGRKTRLKWLQLLVKNLEYFGLGFFLATSSFI